MRRTSGKAIIDISLVRLILNGHNPRSIAMTNRIAHKPGEFSHGLTNQFVTGFMKQGCSPALMQWLAERPDALGNLVEFAMLGCPSIDTSGKRLMTPIVDGADLAKLILEDDFISLEEVSKIYGWKYSHEQLMHFAQTFPDMETLSWLRTNGYVLVPGPTSDKSLLDLYDTLGVTRFHHYNVNNIWFRDKRHTFSHRDVVRGGEWLMLRKEGLPNSHSKNLEEQRELIKWPECIANTPEVVYAIATYTSLREKNILQKYIRTSSVSGSGGRVSVGFSDAYGLVISDDSDTYRSDALGIASAR